MRRWVGGATAVIVICAAGCTAPASAVPGQPLNSPAARNVGATNPYDLYTHCGIREARIGNDYYVASPILDDGQGNPPAGWGNPSASGTMTINPDNTADFRDTAGHRAHFVLRPGATTWLQICS